MSKSQKKKNEKARLNLFVEKIHRSFQKIVRINKPHKIHQVIPFFYWEQQQRSYENKNTAMEYQNQSEVLKSYHQWSKHLIAFSKQHSLKKNRLKQNEYLVELIKNKQQELIPYKQKPIFIYEKYRKTIHTSEKCLKHQVKQKSSELLTAPITLTLSRKSSNLNYKHTPYFQKMKKKIKLEEELCSGDIRFEDAESKKYSNYLPKEFKNLDLTHSMHNQTKGNKFTNINKQSYQKVEPWLHTIDDAKLDTF